MYISERRTNHRTIDSMANCAVALEQSLSLGNQGLISFCLGRPGITLSFLGISTTSSILGLDVGHN